MKLPEAEVVLRDIRTYFLVQLMHFSLYLCDVFVTQAAQSCYQSQVCLTLPSELYSSSYSEHLDKRASSTNPIHN